jgi:hypothetical protein
VVFSGGVFTVSVATFTRLYQNLNIYGDVLAKGSAYKGLKTKGNICYENTRCDLVVCWQGTLTN